MYIYIFFFNFNELIMNDLQIKIIYKEMSKLNFLKFKNVFSMFIDEYLLLNVSLLFIEES